MPTPPPAPSALRQLLTHQRPGWHLISALVFLSLAGTLLLLVFPAIVRLLVDEAIPSAEKNRVWQLAGLAAAAFILRELISSWRLRLSGILEQQQAAQLRALLHEKILALPITWHQQQQTGDVLTRVADDVPLVARTWVETVEQGLTALLQLIVVTLMLLILHWQLALIVLLPVPLIAAGGWLYAHWVTPRARSVREATSSLNQSLMETLSGIRQVKSYLATAWRSQLFDQKNHHLRSQQQRQTRAWSLYAPLMSLIGHLGLMLLLLVGATWVISGSLSPGTLMQFVLLLGFLYEPISRLHGVNQVWATGEASAERLQALLQLPDEAIHQGSTPIIRGALSVEGLAFSYQPDQPLLLDLHFQMAQGQTIGIVGATGSGKTTLFQLLCRFLTPQQGQILIDGHPIQHMAPAHLRRHIAYVTQEPFLFEGSIRQNLLLSQDPPTAASTDDTLWSALESAQAADFVRALPAGLDTDVGERGSRLSGGEKQRISLARALLKPAPILLLDEATSALDSLSESAIQQAMASRRGQQSILIIAHRLASVQQADQILVLRSGKIHATGTHSQLLDSDPYYQSLVTGLRQ
jgi:ABC-type multidrug transport system fused ATPase/permease subunit